MTDLTPIPATLLAGLRYLIAAIVPLAISKGWIDAENVDGITGIVIAVATVGWGLYKTHDRQKKLVG